MRMDSTYPDIPDYANAHLARHRDQHGIATPLHLRDGNLLSIQASEGNYCSPRFGNEAGPWTHVEMMALENNAPLSFPPSWEVFRNNDSGEPFGFLPVSMLNAWIHGQGGAVVDFD